jgi:membrane protein
MGAVVCAYLPSLLSGQAGRVAATGWAFELALAALQHLHRARGSAPHGLKAQALAHALRVELLQLEPLLQTLRQIQWVAPMDSMAGDEPVWVLLVDPDHTFLSPLTDALLLEPGPAAQLFWQRSGWQTMSLRSVL